MIGLEQRSQTGTDPRVVVGSALVGAAAAGMAAMYFLDPDRGRSRRAQTADRLAGMVRRTIGRAERGSRWAGAEAYGVQQRLRHLGPDQNPPTDDWTLKDKVESILFRDPQIPKGTINVHSEDGVVVLKGTARTPGLINEIEKRARSIDGVRDVRSELHPDNTPAPEYQAAVLGQG